MVCMRKKEKDDKSLSTPANGVYVIDVSQENDLTKNDYCDPNSDFGLINDYDESLFEDTFSREERDAYVEMATVPALAVVGDTLTDPDCFLDLCQCVVDICEFLN